MTPDSNLGASAAPAYSNPHSGWNPSPVSEQAASGGPFGHDIDTVHFRVDGSFDQDCLSGLDKHEMLMGDTGSWLYSTARYRNIRLTASPSSIRGCGSLAVLTMGSNATPFDHHLLAVALGDFSAALGIDSDILLAGSLRRLDVGANVPLSRPVAEVTGAMVRPPRRRLVTHGPASVEVVTHRHRFAVYDKRAERKAKKGGHVSPVYGPGPVARVESRHMSRVDDQLRRPVTLGSLLDPAFFDDLGRRLIADTHALCFEPSVPWKMLSLPSELGDWLAAQGMERVGGLEAVLEIIEESKRQGVAVGHQPRALRKKARTIAEAARADDPEDVGREFVAAVRTAVGF